MVFCRGGEDPFCSFVTDGTHELRSDIPVDRGGRDDGFMPSTLIEGALAACVNITLRKYAQTRGIKLSDVVVRVSMNKHDPKKILMEQQVQLIGDLTEKERADLLQVAEQCPVQKILSGEFVFHLKESRSDIKLEPAPKKIFA
ncbi:MAG: OsmC family protein [Syntrophobacteraceae bacterium]|jgi:putative redox protein